MQNPKKPLSTASSKTETEGTSQTHLYHANDEEKNLHLADIQPQVPLPETIEHNSHVAPEGGYGWLIVMASFSVNAVIYGLQTSFGVFQAAYKQPGAFPNATTSSIALISAVGAASSSIFGIATGRFSEIYGFRAMAVIGSVILPTGLFLASFAQETWHLVLTQGILYGLGAGCIYYPALTVLTHYFYKRRGLAMGIAVSGSGIGGLVLAPVTQKLIDVLEWRRAIQIVALICFVVLAASAAVLKPLIPAKRKGGLDFTLFKDGVFLRLYLLGIFMTFGYLIPYTFMAVQAQSIGLTVQDAATCILAANGMSALGRISMGYLGDKIGQIHILILSNMVSSLSQLVLWPLANSFPTLLVFSCVYGYFSGAFFTAFPLVTAHFYGESRLASVAGMLFSCYAIGNLSGAPIAGALVDAIRTDDPASLFRPAMFFAGGTMGCACMIAVWMRAIHWGWKLRIKA